MADLTDWLCPACGHRWKHRDEQSSCPKCHVNMSTDYPVPNMGRLTCSYWMWARPNVAQGAQCGARMVVSVGETLGFCQTHAKNVMSLPRDKQEMLGVRHLA